MKAIIIGGGKVGNYIVKELSKFSYDLCLIEKNSATCQKIAEEANIEIINGDGTELSVLIDADIENADVVAAITGKDEENFVICQIAKREFGVKKTIARISNPKNSKMFKKLSVDRVICSTEIIADIIEWELENKSTYILSTFDDKGSMLLEATIGKDNYWIGYGVSAIKIPNRCKIVSIIRDSGLIYPDEHTTILYGDKLLVMGNSADKKIIENIIYGMKARGI